MKKTINIIEKRLPWGIIGVLIGIAGLVVGIYYAIYYEKKSEVSFQIVNESDILDIRKPLKDLDIYFEGEDIQKDNLNLKVIRLKIINTGQVDILQSFYDKNDEWGFKVSDGKIIEIRRTETNSKYLEENINPVQLNANSIKLEKIILEKEKYVSFEILVLHNKSSPPYIIPAGKIAGIDNFLITDSISNNEETSFWNGLFYGKLHIHMIRFIMYFSLFVIAMILIVMSVSSITSFRDKVQSNKRKRKLERLALPSGKKDSSLDIIYKSYMNGDFDFIEKLNGALKSNLDIKKRIEKVNITKKYENDLRHLESDDGLDRHNDYYPKYSFLQENEFRLNKYYRDAKMDNVLYGLLKDKKIIIEDEKTIIDPEFQNALNVIIAIIS